MGNTECPRKTKHVTKSYTILFRVFEFVTTAQNDSRSVINMSSLK